MEKSIFQHKLLVCFQQFTLNGYRLWDNDAGGIGWKCQRWHSFQANGQGGGGGWGTELVERDINNMPPGVTLKVA